MISFIRGIVVAFGADYIVLDNGGIGYRMTFMQAAAVSIGQEVTLYTHMHIREDDLSLFAFVNPLDLEIFKQLINVKGLGPKTAITMLGSNNGQRILTAIEEQDVAYLKSLPGIGAKTASQMVLDLKGKLVTTAAGSKAGTNPAVIEAVDALKDLGFKNAELTWIEKELNQMAPESSVQAMIKHGLQLLQTRKGGQ